MQVHIPFLTMVLFVSGLAQSQNTMIRRDSSGQLHVAEAQPFILKEVGAAVFFADGGLKVIDVLPANRRPSAYRSIDVEQNDVIVMANAKHLGNVKDLESIYDSLRVGDVLRLGIRRKSDLHLVSMTKADPKDLPRLQMKIMHGGPAEGGGVFRLAGVVMKRKGTSIVIDELLPGETPIQHADVKPGDVLVSMNSKSFASLEQYEHAFSEIPAGQSVHWSLRRGDKVHQVTFVKPEARIIVRQKDATQ